MNFEFHSKRNEFPDFCQMGDCCDATMMIGHLSVGDLEAIVTKEALEFYRAHGEDSIRILKEAIWLALTEKDDDRALRLDQWLYEIEQFVNDLNAPKH